MTQWSAQSIQFAWFGNGLDDNTNVDHVYQACFGLVPESTQRNRVPSPQNPLWGTASGLTNEGLLGEVTVQPGRLDVYLRPKPETPVIPDLGVAISANVGSVANSLAALGKSLRIAIVMEAVNMAVDAAAASSLAQRLAGLNVQVDDALDFLLQMNRRKGFVCVPGQMMNRLTRIGTAQFQFYRIDIRRPDAPVPVTQITHATSAFLDFNNVPERPLDGAEQVAMFGEIGQAILEFAEEPSVARLME